MRFLQAATILQSTASLLRLPPIAHSFVLSPTKQVQLLHTSSKIAISRRRRYTQRFIGTIPSSSSQLQSTPSPKSYFSSLSNFSPMPDLSYPLLTAQNATTTNAIINHYATSPDFTTLSNYEGSAILQRDAEDAEKLQRESILPKPRG